MEAPQGEGGGGIGVVVLHEGAVDAERGEGRDGVNLGEPATGIAMAFRADELDGVLDHRRSLMSVVDSCQPESAYGNVKKVYVNSPANWKANSGHSAIALIDMIGFG